MREEQIVPFDERPYGLDEVREFNRRIEELGKSTFNSLPNTGGLFAFREALMRPFFSRRLSPMTAIALYFDYTRFLFGYSHYSLHGETVHSIYFGPFTLRISRL